MRFREAKTWVHAASASRVLPVLGFPQSLQNFFVTRLLLRGSGPGSFKDEDQ
jgi:hypothetical protein